MAGLLFFCSDLRCKHHEPLKDALINEDKVLACFFFHKPSLDKYGGRRNKFLLESLIILEKELCQIGVPLLVYHVRNSQEIKQQAIKLIRKEQIDSLYFNRPIDPKDQHLIAVFIKQASLKVHEYNDQTFFPLASILTKNKEPYKIFTPFYKKIVAKLKVNPKISDIKITKQHSPLRSKKIVAPSWLKLEDYNDKEFSPGEQSGLKRLREFLEDDVATYEQDRDFYTRKTSYLSPYLALGCISIRTCLNEIKLKNPKFLQERAGGINTFFKELMWREFFRHVWFNFEKISKGAPFRDKGKKISWRNSPADFECWQKGKTGIPIIDAAMRAFRQTGFMHNRLRMIVASFLSKNLLLDWHLGETYFLKHLIDADLANNNGGWQWSASVGCDAQPYFRIFNPIAQSSRWDKRGEFIRKWILQLSTLDNNSIHAPYRKFSNKQLNDLGYLAPICDIEKSQKRAIKMYKNAFKN